MMGLDSLFTFYKQPLRIVCKNGNEFLARGCDDTFRLKSIKDVTCAWYEEEIPSEEDFQTITTSIRTPRASFLQEIFSINPEVDGDYKEHWFYKKFYGDRLEKTFSDKLSERIKYTVHHSTYKDNRWLPPEFGEYLESLKNSKNPINRYYYTIYTLGEWGNKLTGGNFYKMFDRGNNVGEHSYNPNLPIWLSFDFNVNPGMHALIIQNQGKEVRIVDEIKTESPRNNTAGLCREFIRRYSGHNAGLFITGDPSGRNEDTRTEAGHNDYKIIKNELAQFSPAVRVDTVHPPVVPRGNFINNVFESEYKGARIVIDSKCVGLINDLMNLKESPDGTKFKQKAKDKHTGVTSEKYGHYTDSLDYAVIQLLRKEFEEYLNGNRSVKVAMGKRQESEAHGY
jgi:hypothetical protein